MDDVITIDGPAASGKSTVARGVAAKLGYVFADSGALYRAVTWMALERAVACNDAEQVKALLLQIDIQFELRDGAVTFTVNGIDPGAAIREERVNRNVSPVAAVPEVRKQVVNWLRSMSRFGNLVMEGRDIGTVVFPDAPHKFYLDASPEERARRRHNEMTESGEDVSLTAIGDSLTRRDKIDSGRKVDPLRVAQGAQIVDTTGMSIDEVVDHIAAAVAEHRRQGDDAG